jgi:hypothetical protein
MNEISLLFYAYHSGRENEEKRKMKKYYIKTDIFCTFFYILFLCPSFLDPYDSPFLKFFHSFVVFMKLYLSCIYISFYILLHFISVRLYRWRSKKVIVLLIDEGLFPFRSPLQVFPLDVYLMKDEEIRYD